LRQANEELQKMQRLESIGMLAGGIAHDFNNLLGGILGNIDMARDFIDNRESAVKYIDRALAAFARAKDLTQQLLTFSKGGAPNKDTVSIDTLLEETKALALSGSNASCDMKVSQKLRTVEADVNQLSQVLNNIFLNARQAMPDGGKITVTARNKSVSANQIHGLTEG
ncbi:MAG: hybrid sensor histidine kinase/response regulator, partial [bacterium]|nr:hybrid sensor histidine kinase/response regulator [bacterium]